MTYRNEGKKGTTSRSRGKERDIHVSKSGGQWKEKEALQQVEQPCM
jgi:hypothetical protein